MANRTISTKVLNVVYTTEQLSQEPVSTTVISKGLLVIENTTDGKVKLKVGDGVNVYANLPYLSDPSVAKQIEDALATLNNIMTIKGTVESVEALNQITDVKTGDVYFVGTVAGNYSEYVRTAAGQWEYIGVVQSEVDLSGYYTSAQVDTLLSNKANNTLTGYAKGSDGSAITEADTVQSALSKLENQIENKANDGSEIVLTGYAKGTDSSDVSATDTVNQAISKLENQMDSHSHGADDITAMTSYVKPTTLTEKTIQASDTLNQAVGKLEKNMDDKLDINDTYVINCTL